MKTIAIIVLGILLIILTLGIWDPFQLLQKKGIKPIKTIEEMDKDRENEKGKIKGQAMGAIADIATHDPGNDRDNALKGWLDKDYPGSK